MNRHTLLDVYLGLRADALRVVTGALMLSSAGGAAEAARPEPGSEAATRPAYTGVVPKGNPSDPDNLPIA